MSSLQNVRLRAVRCVEIVPCKSVFYFSSHRQSGTFSVVVTATCATSWVWCQGEFVDQNPRACRLRERNCADNTPVQQGGSRQYRSPCPWKSTTWRLSTSWLVQQRAFGHKRFGRVNGDDIREAWKARYGKQHREQKIREPAGPVLCDMKDLGISLRGWKVLRSSSNKMISMRDTRPEDVKNKL